MGDDSVDPMLPLPFSTRMCSWLESVDGGKVPCAFLPPAAAAAEQEKQWGGAAVQRGGAGHPWCGRGASSEACDGDDECGTGQEAYDGSVGRQGRDGAGGGERRSR